MITRIVKLHFKPGNAAAFKKLFDVAAPQILKFEGCEKVELLGDISNPDIFFTHSLWQSPEHLDAYRNSALFKSWWVEVKKLFAGKAEAWSLENASK